MVSSSTSEDRRSASSSTTSTCAPTSRPPPDTPFPPPQGLHEGQQSGTRVALCVQGGPSRLAGLRRGRARSLHRLHQNSRDSGRLRSRGGTWRLGGPSPGEGASLLFHERRALEQARKAHPALHVDSPAFLHFLSRRRPALDPEGVPLHAADLYLVAAALEGQGAALELLDARLRALLARAHSAGSAPTTSCGARCCSARASGCWWAPGCRSSPNTRDAEGSIRSSARC